MGEHDEDQRPRSDEPVDEALERAWASNDKIAFDAILGMLRSQGLTSEAGGRQTLRAGNYGDLALANAINLAQQVSQAAVTHVKNMDSSFAANWDAGHKNRVENNRFTLDRLYGVFPEEAMGIGSMVQAVVAALKETGWKPSA